MHLNFRNVNDAFYSMVYTFNEPELNDITETQSRNGPVLMITEPVTLTYREPRERVLFNSARDCNPFFHLYEALWMLSGRNDVAPVAYYASNMRNYSDDGTTLNGAYGYRWKFANEFECLIITTDGSWGKPDGSNLRFKRNKIDQLDLIVQHLKADPNSRRAVLQMWNVEDDLLKIGGLDAGVDPSDPSIFRQTLPSKDVACNLSVMFSLREGARLPLNPSHHPSSWTEGRPYIDGRYLDMTVTNRSNDMIWGCLGANYVHFSMLQEYIAARLGVEVGKYHHFTNNLHVYKDKFEPEKWIRAHDEDVTDEVTYNRLHHLYAYSKPKLIPLVQNPEVFEDELPRFVESFSGKKTSIGNWQEPFFDTVAQPMLTAFSEYKLGLLASALEFAETIEDDAWRIAAVRWLQRRKEKRDGK